MITFFTIFISLYCLIKIFLINDSFRGYFFSYSVGERLGLIIIFLAIIAQSSAQNDIPHPHSKNEYFIAYLAFILSMMLLMILFTKYKFDKRLRMPILILGILQGGIAMVFSTIAETPINLKLLSSIVIITMPTAVFYELTQQGKSDHKDKTEQNKT